jgi:hypothetical protein
MRLFPARMASGPLNRSTAWGCLTSNLALPGTGSLLAGRVSGYFQFSMALAGFGLTTVFGLRFIAWSISHWTDMQDIGVDPVDRLWDMWLAMRWACLGLGLFGVSWIWGLASSLDILRRATRSAASKPPVMAR